MDASVAFCIYNRPEPTARVFEAIRRWRPARLLVIADGPKKSRPIDLDSTNECRRIASQVDWPCDLLHNWSDENLGCRERMATGLDWAFEQSEQLIVLEDDCLPGKDFFPFVTELLERYADDDRVAMISGNNFQPSPVTEDSYYFSRWAHIWGWASWRRAWKHFDASIASWPEIRDAGFLQACTDCPAELQHWQQVFDDVHENRIDTWDFSWMYACWLHGGMTVLPAKNLVTNLGFGSGATHTTDLNSPLANMKTERLTRPLRHPNHCLRHRLADLWTWENIFNPKQDRQQTNHQHSNRRIKLPFWGKKRRQSA